MSIRCLGMNVVMEHLGGGMLGTKIFTTPEEMWEHVLDEVRKHGPDERDALEELKHAYGSLMLYIRRDELQMLRDAEEALQAAVKSADSIDSPVFSASLSGIRKIREYRASMDEIDGIYVDAVLRPMLQKHMAEQAVIVD